MLQYDATQLNSISNELNLKLCKNNINPLNTDGEHFSADELLLLLIIYAKIISVCLSVKVIARHCDGYMSVLNVSYRYQGENNDKTLCHMIKTLLHASVPEIPYTQSRLVLPTELKQV